MPMYGFRLEITRPGMDSGTRGIKRVEFDAPGPRTAGEMLDGWAAVEGVTIVERDLIADGCTFLEAGKRRITNLAADLSREFGATVVGPFEIGGGDTPGYAVRVLLRNGNGVSIATGGPHERYPAPVIEFITCHDDETDVFWDVFPEALTGSQNGSEDGSTDLEEIRAVMRKLPQP